jgi:3-oxoacyl-[acyl-carrier-protein] synthase-1
MENNQQQPVSENSQIQETSSKAMALNNIAITGMGLNCVTGSEPIALFGAVGTNLGFSQPDLVLEAPSATGDGVESIVTCSIVDYDEEDPNDRMLTCMLPALADAIDTARLFEVPRKNILFYLVVPSQETARGECLLMDEWYSLLHHELEELGDIEIRIKSCTQSVTEHLMFVADGLQQRHWDTVIFGAVDSMVDQLTCMELGKQLRIQTTETADGVIPGEAAGFIVMEHREALRGIDDLPYAWLKGMSVQEEPNHGNPDLQCLTGLSQAMNAVLTACGISKERLGSLILALGTEQTDMIEWHQTENMLWPYQASEQETTALRLGEVDMIDPAPPAMPEKLELNLTLGDIGIASVPVSIILAAARFEFPHPVSKRALILESGETPFRGVIYVKHPTNGQQIEQLVEDAA